VTLSLNTSTPSLCAISGVDKAVTFLDRDRAIDIGKIFTELKRYTASSYNDYSDYSVLDCYNQNRKLLNCFEPILSNI
jgi:hypothetical protein